jgi:hypothetical protein
MRSQLVDLRAERIIFLQHHFGNGDDLRFTNIGCIKALLLESAAFRSRCIHSYLANAQMVVLEHLETALFLRGMMVGLRAPPNDRLSSRQAERDSRRPFVRLLENGSMAMNPSIASSFGFRYLASLRYSSNFSGFG